jgi:hypothetical protein
MLKPTPITCSAISVNNEITLFHTGPSLDKGPMATVFYFALSGEDSLCLDPFNQIVQFLSNHNIRIFSMTLPAHEANLPPQNAINVWAEDISKGRNIIQDFCEMANTAIDFAVQKGFTLDNKIALAGLSRGGFIASHLAAINDKARFLLLFAPLTDLKFAKEFENIKDHPIVLSLDLAHIIEKICDRHIRAYIGNRDKRVSTRSTFDFIENLSNHAFDKKMRSPQVELIISPSIGHLGHGTPPQIFKNGADWLIECLL